MNIGFDIDGVLADVESFQWKYGQEYFHKKFNMEMINRFGYGIKEIFGCSPDIEMKFWKRYMLKYAITEQPRKNAVSTIQKLYNDGNKIHIISSRAMTSKDNFAGSLMRFLTKYWLNKWKIPYDTITFCSIEKSDKDKEEACLKYAIDIMVEDKAENVIALSKITRVLCFHTMSNKLCVGINIIRAHNFDEIYKIITEMDCNKQENTQFYITKHNFQILTREEKNRLSEMERIEYFKNLRRYYLNQPFDKELHKKQEWNNLLFRALFRPFAIFFNQQIYGLENLPKQNGFIIVSNHIHLYDTLLILSKIKKTPYRLLAKQEVLQYKIGPLYKWSGCIFVDRKNADSRRQSKIELIKTVINGGNVLIFPEGTINYTREKPLLKLEYGAVSISQITGASIVPIAITNDYCFMSKNLFVRIGTPIQISIEEDLTQANERLERAFEELIKENEINRK